jgi:hypothetical protein
MIPILASPYRPAAREKPHIEAGRNCMLPHTGLVFWLNSAKIARYHTYANLEEHMSDAAAARSVIDIRVFSSGRLDMSRRRGDQSRFPQQ